jgi:hypothetical protein
MRLALEFPQQKINLRKFSIDAMSSQSTGFGHKYWLRLNFIFCGRRAKRRAACWPTLI